MNTGTIQTIALIYLLVLNNIVWMIFFYLFTPEKKKQKISLPKIKLTMPKLPKKEKNDMKDLEDLASSNLKANEILDSMMK